MSKALKIAAVVVAVVAITVATAGIGTAPAIAASSTVVAGTTFATAAVAATGASIFGLSVATLTTIATGLSLASSVLAKPPRSTSSANGSQTDWKADPGSGVPYAMGRTFNAGNIVHRASYGGTDNPYESIVTVYSASGPIGSIESVQFDGVVQAIAGGAIGGALAGYAWVSTQLGAKPEAAALAGPFGSFPGWDATSKLSGKMAAITTFKFDKDGKKFPGGEPKQGIVANWVKVYDPRLDSTYPGGSGAHRSNNEATWAWSQNPWLHALTWALGRYENGVRTVGVGIAPAAIDIAAYVEAANVADANSWALGGVIYSTDDKWNAIKQMAAAGGGEPIRRGGQLSAFVNKPRTSLLTIGEDDLTGDVKATAMQSRRSRLNGIVPIYRSEANDWQMVPGTVVRSSTYLAEDGALRTREQAYDLVQSGAQVGQLAAYALANGRELSPITVPCKPYMLQVRSGDAVTLNIPSAGLSNQLVVVLRREIDFANATVSLICRTETTAKHSYALGQTSTAPPTPSLTATGNPIVQLPWAAMVGDGKPEDNATKGTNLIFNGDASQGLDGWAFDEGNGQPINFFELSAPSESLGGQYSFALRKAGLSETVNVVGVAIPVVPGQKFAFRARYYGSHTTTTGLYLRINQRASKAVPANNRVGVTQRDGGTVGAELTDIVSSGPVGLGLTTTEALYTVPPGIYWISPAVYNWTNGPVKLIFDDLSLVPVTNWATGVDGSGKPENYATSADNMIFNGSAGQSASGWFVGAGVDWVGSQPAGTPSGGLFRFNPVSTGGTLIANNNNFIVLNGAPKVYPSGYVYVEGGTTGPVYFAIDWYNSIDGYISSSPSIDVMAFGAFFPNSWVPWKGPALVPPTGAAKGIAYYRRANAGTYYIYLTNSRLAKTESAADVTLTAQIVVDVTQNKEVAADYMGAVTGTVPVLFSPSVKRGSTSIKTDDSTTYSVVASDGTTAGGDGGTVTVDNATGSSTKGDVSITPTNTDAKATTRLKVFSSGVLVGQFDLTLTKRNAAAPAGGGGTGGSGSSTKSATRTGSGSSNTVSYAPTFSGTAPRLTVASGEKLYASFVGTYGVSPGTAPRQRYGQFKHSYSADGTSWTDFGSGAVTGSAATPMYTSGGTEPETFDPVDGSITINQNQTVTAGDWYVRTVWEITTITGSRTLSITGGGGTYEAKP